MEGNKRAADVAPQKSTKRKRSKSEATGHGTSSLSAKKSRKDTHKVKGTEAFVEMTESERRLLDIHYPLDECIARHRVMTYVEDMRQRKQRSKIHIKITDEFIMTIQNVVMTVELCYPATTPPLPATIGLDQRIVANGFAMLNSGGNRLDMEDLIALAEDEEVNIAESSLAPSATGASYFIPLNDLTRYWRHYGAQHNNRRFTAVIQRDFELNAASLVFGSGNIVCTGCDRPELALWLLHSTLEKLRAVGFRNFEMPRPHLRNIVSSGRFPNTLCSALLAVLYSDCCVRADKFPGTMIFHQKTGKRVALVFDSGKICHSGAHTIEEIRHDMRIIYPMLVRCQYTVQNQKDNERCSHILNMDLASHERSVTIHKMRDQIEHEQRQHQLTIQQHRTQSAQQRNAKAREQPTKR